MSTLFQLQFDPSKVEEIASRYSFKEDVDPLEAGKEIRIGKHTRENIQRIFEWKTKGRGRSRLDKNSDQDIADALSLATKGKSDRAAVAVLMGLNGVQVPVASAILTAIDPEHFTVIDFRALEALGVTTANMTINYYLEYLDACRGLARENKVTLRTLDRALWQWSKERASHKRN